MESDNPRHGSVIPIIDVSPFCAAVVASPADRQRCANEWNHAMSSVGFAVIVGHGISVATIEAARSGFRAFFDRELEYKQQFEYGPYGNPSGGFSSIGREAVARSQDGHGDLQDEEGSKNSTADPVESFVCTTGSPNEWGKSLPAHPVELAATAAEYHDQLNRLLDSLHRLSEQALNLPDGYFEQLYKPVPKNNLVAKFYPENITSDSGLLYGAHTDYTGYTILKPDDNDHSALPGGGTTGGLQVRVSNEWHNVVTTPKNSLVINLGDLWEDITNGRWISAVHRVLAPTASTQPRMSLPFFTGPRNESVMTTLPTCVGEGPLRLSKPMTAGEHLQRKLEATRT